MKKVVSLDKKAKLIGCSIGISLFFVIVVILSHIIKVEEGVEQNLGAHSPSSTK